MAAHQSKLPVVSLGVGAAFDFHAGSVKQAPSWYKRRGSSGSLDLLWNRAVCGNAISSTILDSFIWSANNFFKDVIER